MKKRLFKADVFSSRGVKRHTFEIGNGEDFITGFGPDKAEIVNFPPKY